MSEGRLPASGPRSVLVVGLGLMGGSLGQALRRAGWYVLGADRDPAVLARAVELGAIDEPGAVGDAADLTVLAVPVLAVREVLPQLPRDRLVTDLCSTKEAVVRWAADAGLNFVGGHPLCGSEQSGIEAASPDLYGGAAWALTRAEPAVEEMVVAAGARPLIVEPAEHDRLVAGISHAAFVISAAYMLACAGDPDWPAMGGLAARGFRDMTRLAGGEPAMYAGIVSTNAANIRARLEEFRARLQLISEQVEAGPEALERLFADARRARVDWEQAQRA